MPVLLTRQMRKAGPSPHSLQSHPHICQPGEPDPAMPGQAGEKAWARLEEPQVFALNMCPGKSACLPAHLLTLAWLIGSESPTQQGSKKQKLPLGGPQADGQA